MENPRHSACGIASRTGTRLGLACLLAAGGACLSAGAQGKSGIGPDHVQLPSGPGTVTGYGAEYDKDLPTGGASMEIPIDVPRGLADFHPEVTLAYESGGGNSVLGFGWDLGFYQVQRRASLPLARYVDGPNGTDDDFDGVIDEEDEVDKIRAYFGGAPIDLVSEDDLDPEDDLVPQGTGYFFTNIEEDFVRYQKIDDYWRGVQPDGYAFEFGLTEQSRVIDPDDPSRVFAWRMERQHDLSGNVIEYLYFRDDDNEAIRGNLYLDEIRYGLGEPPWEQFHFVKFNYEARPDVYETGVPGFMMREGLRMTAIITGTQLAKPLEGHLAGDFNNDGVTDYLNARYEIRYETHPYWSFISSIQKFGADGITALPPVTLTWNLCDPPQTIDASDSYIGAANPPLKLPNNPAAAFTELNGDGLPDILVTDPTVGPHRAYLNLGQSMGPDGPVINWSAPATIGGDGRVFTVDLADPNEIAELADLDADGRSDLVYKAGPFETYYFPQLIENGQPLWGERQRMNLFQGESAPPSPYGAENVTSGDWNSDKFMDVAQMTRAGAGSQLKVWYNLEGRRYSKPVTYTLDIPYDLTSEGASFTDFNGDGLDDFVHIRPTEIEVWPSLGYGRFAPKRVAPIPDYTLLNQFIERAELDDVTGDGFPELVVDQAEPGVLWYWVGRGNYTFEPRRTITGLPVPRGNNPGVDAADLNGNGSDDRVYMDDASGPRMTVVDLGLLLGCSPAPNLLAEISNGHGRRTKYTYATTTEFLLADAAAGNPWTYALPMNLPVVSRVDNYDSLGNEYTELYRYRDGYYDPRFKAFAGFGGATMDDLGDSTVPTERRVYTFDVGKENSALRGKLLEERLEDTAGNVQWVEKTEWEVRQLGDTSVENPVEIAVEKRMTREVFESGRGTPVLMEKEFVYDNVGNIVEERDYGVVVNGDRAAYNDEVITVTEFAVNIDDWLVRYPFRVEVRDFAGNVVKRTETYYDDDTLEGSNPGEVYYAANNVEFVWVNPNDPEGYIVTQRWIWDDYGNIGWFIDGLAEIVDGEPLEEFGHYRYVEFDEVFQTNPIRETIYRGGALEPLVLEADYDVGLNTVLASRDFSGNETRYEYDGLGRPTKVFRPGDDPDFPSVEYAYATGVSVGTKVINWVETRMLDREPRSQASREDHYRFARSFVSGMGETVLQKEEAEPNPESGAPRVAVTQAVIFNGRGKVRYMLNPYYSTQGASLQELLAFEDILDPTWSGLFLTESGLQPLSLEDSHRIETLYDVELRPTRVFTQDRHYRETVYEPLITKIYDENDTDPTSPYFDTPLIHYRDAQDRIIRVDEVSRLNDDGTPATGLQTWTTTYEYRADGARTRIVDSQGNTRLMSYDGLKRLTELNDPNQGVTTFTYDAASNMLSRTDAAGRTTLFTYDAINRILTEDQLDESEAYSLGFAYDPEQPINESNRPDVAYFYDAPVENLDFGDGTSGTAENTLGKLAYVWDQAGEHHSSYDARGRLAWSVRSLVDPRSQLPVPYRTSLEYDTMDRVTAVNYPDGDRVEYAYNERNLVEQISGGALSNVGGQGAVLTATSYSPSGQRLSFAYGNGTSSAFRYDARKRLTHLRTLDSQRNTLQEFTYEFDAVSNLLQISDLRPAAGVPEGDERRNHQRFDYDDLYRLTGATYAFGESPDTLDAGQGIRYRYDRIGNLLSQTSPIVDLEGRLSKVNLGELSYGGSAGATGRVGRNADDPPGPNALTFVDDGFFTREYTYDAMGNMLQWDGLSMTWNFANQMVAAENDRMRAEYRYDYSGERVMKILYNKDKEGDLPDEPSHVVQYVAKYFEVREGEQPVKYVYNGDDRLARVLGTLDPGAERIQRFRFAPGWNLSAMGVEASDASAQLGIGLSPLLAGAYLWDPESGDYVELDSASPLPGGSVFWVYADEATHVAVRGLPVNQDAEADAVPGFNVLRALHAANPQTALPDTLDFVWAYDADTQSWRSRIAGDNAFLSDFPDFVQAGQPVYLAFNDPATLELGGPELDLQYYHEDHLGSASLVTAADGSVIEETAYYPYGEPRNQYKAASAAATLPNPYLFNHKERDAESNLQYFEARYLTAPLARFNRVDPAAENPPDEAIADPQQLNAYAYARNNPITLTDPDGRFIRTRAGKVLLKQFNPFSDQASGNLTDNKFLRRARVFGALGVDKGGKLFENGFSSGAGSIPDFAQKEIAKLKNESLSSPNKLISDLEQVALKLKKANPDNKKLNVDSFLQAITQKADSRGALGSSLLEQFGKLGATPDKLEDSPITKAGSIVNEGIAKQIGALQNSIRGLDLKGKLAELTEKGNKGLQFKDSKGFKFNQSDVEKFIDNFLGGADTVTELNRTETSRTDDRDDSDEDDGPTDD